MCAGFVFVKNSFVLPKQELDGWTALDRPSAALARGIFQARADVADVWLDADRHRGECRRLGRLAVGGDRVGHLGHDGVADDGDETESRKAQRGG